MKIHKIVGLKYRSSHWSLAMSREWMRGLTTRYLQLTSIFVRFSDCLEATAMESDRCNLPRPTRDRGQTNLAKFFTYMPTSKFKLLETRKRPQLAQLLDTAQEIKPSPGAYLATSMTSLGAATHLYFGLQSRSWVPRANKPALSIDVT